MNHDCASVVRDALVERENALALAARVRELEAELYRLRANPYGDRYPGGCPYEVSVYHEASGGRIVVAWSATAEKASAIASYLENEHALPFPQVRDVRAAQSPPAAEPQKTGG